VRCLIQRVSRAEVAVRGQPSGAIGSGLVVLVGFAQADGAPEIAWMADKLVHLRVFSSDLTTGERSLLEVGGELLIVSQFTLYADVRQGRRPDFSRALKKSRAQQLYDQFLSSFEPYAIHPQSGVFGSEMELTLINSGPFTLWVEREPEPKGESTAAY